MTAAQKWALGIILLASSTLAITYNVLQPIWEAPDEPAHFGYIRYVELHHDLPQANLAVRAVDQPWNTTNEYYQAPLYYVILAVALAGVDLPPDAQPHLNPYVAWPNHPWREAVALHRTDEKWPYRGLAEFVHVGRLVSSAFGLISLLATFALVRVVTRNVGLALFATAWLASTPVFLLTSSHLDNDAAAMATGAVTLFLCAYLLVDRRPARPADLVLVSLSLAAALLSKLDTVFLIPLVAATAFLAVNPDASLRRSLARRTASSMIVLALPLAALGAWWLRYERESQSVANVKAGFGVLNVLTVIQRIDGGRLLAALGNWQATVWGGVGWGTLTLWPPAVYVALTLPFVGLATVGLVAIARAWRAPGGFNQKWAGALLVASMIPLFYATIARQADPSIGLDSNARFTLPAMPVVALLVALGVQQIRSARLRQVLSRGYLVTVFGLAIATAFVLIPRIPAPTIPARLVANENEASQRPVATFDDGVDLLAATAAPTVLTPGRDLSVELQWRVVSASGRDFTVFLQLIDQSNRSRVAGFDSIPYESSFPPRLWQAGEIVDEHRSLLVPTDLAPGRYSLVLGSYYHEGDLVRPIGVVPAGQPPNTFELTSWQLVPVASVPRVTR
jgi:hypothetical protein